MPPPEPTAVVPRSSAGSGVVVPHRANLGQRIVARAVYLAIRGVSTTLRWRLRKGAETRIARMPPRVVFAIWHNRLALCLEVHDRFARPHPKDRRLAAIVSASRDGGLLARILELFDVQPARGSSSRRGPQALRELVTRAEMGFDLAVTPDGPRGPRYVVQDGVIAAAQLTGLPIVPVSYQLRWKLRLGSWDGFLVPLPFSRCEVDFEEPIIVPRDVDDAQREFLRQRLERLMRTMAAD